MTDKTKLNRRDAIKVLGAAAGASVLANIPAKWSKPELSGSTLPAHAQTSCYSLIGEILDADGAFGITFFQGGPSDFENGAFAYWYCQPGCFDIDIFLDGASFVDIQFTTLTSQFVINLNAGNPVEEVLVDMATGDWATGLVGSAGSCTWVIPQGFQGRRSGGTTTKGFGN